MCEFWFLTGLRTSDCMAAVGLGRPAPRDDPHLQSHCARQVKGDNQDEEDRQIKLPQRALDLLKAPGVNTMRLIAGQRLDYAAQQMGYTVGMFVHTHTRWINDGHSALEDQKLEQFLALEAPGIAVISNIK